MHIAQGATVAVVDGQKLSLFRNTSNDAHPKLSALPAESVNTSNKSGGAGHSSSAANPDEATKGEDGFAAGVAELLNRQAVEGKLKELLVIAAPKTLGELRKHYHAKTKDSLVGEISKDLTGQKSDDIERTIAAA
ncbi:host attachment family protein [Aureimonas leprariae]|uniref:Host cell attachment protein n=1 Tax=Plantimonas leprariae TaxID=2615207 RepID=A0A7V7PK08_9HYPH|nr:host attachment protein [Aureimonas leprariae]KAB0675809.1 host cell attachment protein [Aureimonas leprariae]